MNGQASKFRLGVFVLGAMILLAILIIIFGDRRTFFSRQLNYTVKFPQAPGVERGMPVRKSGVKIGEVTDFELNPDTGEVTVEIVVERKYQLRKNDQAVLSRGLVLAESAINFVPKEGEPGEPAPNGHPFEGRPPTDLTGALGKATTLAEAMEAALAEIRNAAKSFNEFMPGLRKTNEEALAGISAFRRAADSVDVLVRTNQEKVSKALDQVTDVATRASNVLSEENQKNLTAALKNIKTASDSLDAMLKNYDLLATDARKSLKTVTDRVESVGKNAEELLKDSRATMKRADEVLINVQTATKPLAERGPAIMKNLDEGAARFNQITVNVYEVTKGLAQENSPVRRFLNDPTFFNNVNDAASGLNKSMSRLDKILRDIEVFADKIARHPELLGIRGAVNPSSGIKP